ncbi:hypothetical protein BH11MYX2_BH11MYX2_31330 [soil metagenome]
MIRRALPLFLLIGTASADDDAPVASPTSATLERADLDRRAHLNETDLLRDLPGATVLGQGGRANDLLMRGFSSGAEPVLHVEVDGVPVELLTHPYASGYADTHFVIADAVSRISLYEGAYAARYGTSATAGTLDITTLDHVAGPTLRMTSWLFADSQATVDRLKHVGYQLTGMASPDVKNGSALLAAEIANDDGPYVHPERFRRGHVLGKWKHIVGGGVASAMVQFYSGRWFDSGYLPRAAIEAGRLSPFSAADATQGGIERRASASIAYETAHTSKKHKNESTWHLGAYIVDSDLRLYTNPTLFRDDTNDGDQIESVDQRVYYGLDGWWRHTYHLGPVTSTLRIGVQARADHVTAQTWHDERRLRLETCSAAMNPCTDTAPQQNMIAGYAEKTSDVGRLRVQPGIRIEENVWNVDDRDPETMLGHTSLGGTGARTRVTPRLALTYRLDAVDLFAGANLGSLGTDARAAVEHSGYGSYDRTRAAETGARFHPSEQLAGAISLWWSRVDTHLAWVPAESRGETIPVAYRRGAEARVVFTPAPWLAFDASLVIARGYSDPADGPSTPVPLMARTSGNGGVSVSRGAFFGGVRVRTLGVRQTTDSTRPANGWTLVDVVAGTRWRDFDLTLTAQNLLDSRWYEAQIASDVRASRTVDVTDDLLISVGQPLTVSLTLGYMPR